MHIGMPELIIVLTLVVLLAISLVLRSLRRR